MTDGANRANRADGLLLSMRGIGKAFAGVPVLEGVDFDLRAGEVHVLAGENGAGKSTLIKIIGGVHTDHSGAMEVEGRPVRFRTPRDAERHGVAVIHQELSLVGAMSVADNLFLGREPVRAGMVVDRASERRRAAEILGRLSLDLDVERAVEDYPIATQQMVEIAKALEKGARIIVMDEPTSALSDPEIARLFEMIRGLRGRGCGIVYITHKMTEIYEIADRITVLRDGRLTGCAAAGELPPSELVRWMIGRPDATLFDRDAPPPGAERLRVEGFTLGDPRGTGRRLVDDVSLSVRAGEIVGVAGLQGSGASELLNGMFGVHGRPEAGRVFLDGEPFAVRSPRASVPRGMALLTNDRKAGGLVLPMSVENNITLAALPALSPGGWLHPRREAAVSRRAADALRIKAASPRQEVVHLSGGNQQKVVLAKWIETAPRVLLLDEPTRGVDVGAKQEIYELMNSWSAQGMAILLITSEMPELLALADRIVVMHRGRVTAEFGRGDATQERILGAAMGGGGAR